MIGLLQDVVFATPLGSQALLTLLLVQCATWATPRAQQQPFVVRWLEAAGVLMLWHGLLWLVVLLVDAQTASLRLLMTAGLVNVLWYPAFYWLFRRRGDYS
jgi:hypothetical protein